MRKYVSITLTALFMLAISANTKLHARQDTEQPNIIFIMADDLGYGDLGCYGQQLVRTPNIDLLAAAGMRFTQAYAGGPVCTPSRSVLMTGLHNGHTPARDNIPHYSTYLEAEDLTIAEVLKQSGYATGGVGKWSLGDAGTVGSATSQGFDTWLGYLNQDHAHYYYPEYLDWDEGRLELSGNTVTRDRYSHDILTNGSLNFIRQHAADPFFLYVAYTLPHFASTEEDEHGFTVPSTEPYTEKDWPVGAKKYAAMLHRLDRDVGQIVQLVGELGLSEETLIIFTSDNGGHSMVWEEINTNGPLRGYKRDLTEGGIRVPFIAAWPGKIPPGTTSHRIIAFQDMMPTFASLAGAGVPANTDGISIVPTLLGEAQEVSHPYLYWDYGHARERYDQAVRLGKWKGIRLGTGSKIALYNLEEDIGEENDLAAEYPEIVSSMEAIMKTAVIPDERYKVGNIYRGGPIWKKEILPIQ
jgi:arylsulfatase A-like enzyme